MTNDAIIFLIVALILCCFYIKCGLSFIYMTGKSDEVSLPVYIVAIVLWLILLFLCPWSDK